MARGLGAFLASHGSPTARPARTGVDRRAKDCKVCGLTADQQAEAGAPHSWEGCEILAELKARYESGQSIHAILAVQHAEMDRWKDTDPEDFWTYSWVRTRLLWAGVRLRKRGRTRALIADRISGKS